MSIATHIAGPYIGTFKGGLVSHTREGFDIEFTTKSEDIDEADLYGGTLLDYVYRGANHVIGFEARSYTATGVLPAFWPWGGNANSGILGSIFTPGFPVGMLASRLSGPLVLTALAGTTAAGNPGTVTAPFCVLAPNTPLKLLFTSKVRNVPIRMVVLPYTVTVGSPSGLATDALLALTFT